MRQTVVLFIVLAVCGCAAARAQGQQEGQNAASPRECVAVIGAVNMPGRLELKRRTRLFEVLAFAGGLKKNAGATVQVISTASKCPQETRDVNVPASTPNLTYQIEDLIGHTKPPNQEALNRYLEAGDIVVVSEAESAFIIGAVLQPQEIVLRRPVTLTQAIQIAGGLKKDAKVEQVRILRNPTDSAPRLELWVNLKEIRKKKAEDPVLQPNDIVEVPGLSPHGPMFSLPDMPKPPVDRVISGWRSGR
jgi:protein involved in polysaccharide export with SLBB domain